jgi:hypothetical protein
MIRGFSKIKSCITQGNEFSDVFVGEVGVRQGEHSPPFLCSSYLNDLEKFVERQ